MGLLGGHSLVPYPLCPLVFLPPGAEVALLQVSPATAPPEQQPGLVLVPTPALGLPAVVEHGKH